MNPLRPKRMISRALITPTSAPTASVTGIAQAPDSNPRPCPAPVGTTSQAATPGARPIVDSRDRSIFLTIRIIAWARTSRAISDMVCRTLMRLSACRKTGLTIWPTIAMTTMAGTSARSRRRARGIRPPSSVVRFATVSLGAAVSARTVSGIEVHSFHRGHEVVVVPAAGDL